MNDVVHDTQQQDGAQLTLLMTFPTHLNTIPQIVRTECHEHCHRDAFGIGESTNLDGHAIRVINDENFFGDNEFGSGKCEKFTNTRHRDYIRWEDVSKKTDTTSVPPEASPTSIPTSGTPYPLAHYVNNNAFSFAQRHFLAAISTDVEPTSFKQAMNNPR